MILRNILTELSFLNVSVYEGDGDELGTPGVHTSLGASLGAEDPDRYIIVCVGFLDITTSMLPGDGPVSVTVGGISGTKLAQASEKNSSGYLSGASIWRVPVPTGTTGDVVVTYSEKISTSSIQLFRLIHTDGEVFDFDEKQENDDTTGYMLSKPLTGHNIGLALSMIRDNTAPTDTIWGGTASPTEIDSITANYNDRSAATFEADGRVSINWSGANSMALAVVTWR